MEAGAKTKGRPVERPPSNRACDWNARALFCGLLLVVDLDVVFFCAAGGSAGGVHGGDLSIR